MSHVTHVVQCLIAICIATTLTYPNGAPDDAAVLQSMRPHHFPGPRRRSSSPYQLDVTETNGTLRMYIDGPFSHRGYLIRVAGAEGGQLGAFQQPPPAGCRLLANGTAATHASSNSKQRTQVVWTLPANRNQSTYIIYYTVVQTFSTYWVRMNRTVTVRAAAASVPVSTPAAPTTTAAATAATTITTSTAAISDDSEVAKAAMATTSAAGSPGVQHEQTISTGATPAAIASTDGHPSVELTATSSQPAADASSGVLVDQFTEAQLPATTTTPQLTQL